MEWFLYFAIAGMVGALIGRSRARTQDGVALGLLLGPIGWLLVALGPDNRRRCGECRGVIPDGARRCMHCGSEIVARVIYKCPACGEQCAMLARDLGHEMSCPVCQRTFATKVDQAKALA